MFSTSLKTVLCESSMFTRDTFRDTHIQRYTHSEIHALLNINLEDLAQTWHSVSVLDQITDLN